MIPKIKIVDEKILDLQTNKADKNGGTVLSDDYTDELLYLKNGYKNESFSFVRGNIDSSGNISMALQYDNIVMSEYIISKEIKVKINAGYQIKCCYFDSNSTYLSASSWTTGENIVRYVITQKAKLVIAKTVMEDTGTTPVETMAQNAIIKSYSLYNPINNLHPSKNYIHFSLDDTTHIIENLKNNISTYTSIFNEPLLAYLKSLHDTYGLKISLYCFNISNLTSITNKFQDEFSENADWLKFGLHSQTSSSSYQSTSSSDASTDWTNFVSNILRITGNMNCIDRMPRLASFYGNKESLLAMRDCYCGALGFLSADDSRSSYYLNSTQNTYLQNNDKFIDNLNGLNFLSTDLRLDWFNSDFTDSLGTYNVPVKNNVYDELVYRASQKETASRYSSLIIFTHEWEIYDGTNLVSSKLSRITDICKFANDYKYTFDYPQNRIEEITSNSLGYISSNCSNGYIDIGETRIEFGSATITNSPTTYTLSMPYANSSYIVTITLTGSNSTYTETFSVTNKTTTTFDVYRTLLANGSSSIQTTGNDTFNYIAIGCKP